MKRKERVLHDNIKDTQKFLLQEIKIYIRDMHEYKGQLEELYDAELPKVDDLLMQVNDLGNAVYDYIVNE